MKSILPDSNRRERTTTTYGILSSFVPCAIPRRKELTEQSEEEQHVLRQNDVADLMVTGKVSSNYTRHRIPIPLIVILLLIPATLCHTVVSSLAYCAESK